MTKAELDVYGKIYDITQKYMDKEKTNISFSKDVFLISIGHRANQVDMSRWMDLKETDFINAAYLQLLRRFPLQEDRYYWINMADYKQKLVNTILSSTEFWGKQTEVLNNPYRANTLKLKIRKYLYGNTVEELHSRWYFKIYMKLPKIIQKAAKKMIGV